MTLAAPYPAELLRVAKKVVWYDSPEETLSERRASRFGLGLSLRRDKQIRDCRYQAQTERPCRRAVEEFERLKKLRAELPNEANNEPEIEPIAPEDVMPPPPPPGRSEAELAFIARFDEIAARSKEEAKTTPRSFPTPMPSPNRIPTTKR